MTVLPDAHRPALSLTFVHLAVFLFGVAGLFGKWLALPSAWITLGRVAFGAMALLLILAVRRMPLQLNSRRDYGLLTVSGVILAVHWVAFFQSIQVAGVAIGLITYATFPIVVTFLEPLFLKSPLTRTDVALALVTFGGALLVIEDFSLGSEITRGFLWGMLSSLTFAMLSVFNKHNVGSYSGLVIALYQFVVATVVLFPALWLADAPDGALTSGRNWLLVVLLGVVFTALAHSLFIQGMRRIRAQTASIIASLESVYGIVFSIVLLSDVPALRTFMGGAVILAAALYSTLRQTEPDDPVSIPAVIAAQPTRDEEPL